ncbi:phosphomethylpyrimidine kinase [Chthoniobacter flavus Ellin428]|uniref:hydroxymethylpyrimidine kinase n=1 Tax=Chthoniobacter flavus Ellin428 TaxID=497964 RepID=B4D0W4_9BACT|nr:bifunctional hydroxymethylpyrimidine kinase/phosphomethylpyrimidine kinase [Chthoniobacter flavus]EDY19976.1 phosphomethylpyrimidine kinase [Chthoniobacter flavus Ellin428]TCO91755.1 hydroxymethylpyrimidine/phosphomethylpyrimidine kinase [Chthoniobacter flavus]
MFPVGLTIAGSDNSAGAGVQADLKTMSALGVYGVTAITCVVAEVPGKVSAIQAIEPRIVAEQIRLLFEAFPIGALKTGMLYSCEIIETVCDTLRGCREPMPQPPPIVVDPVMVATSGDPLLQRDAIALYRERLFPMATLITPNLDEVRTLLDREVTSVAEMRTAGQELVATYGRAFLIKGGHLRLNPAIDLLCAPDGGVQEFSAPFVPGVSTHGTGCTYAAAITAGLAKGLSLSEAASEAKQYLATTVAHFLRWPREDGRTTDALHHFWGKPSA